MAIQIRHNLINIDHEVCSSAEVVPSALDPDEFQSISELNKSNAKKP